MKLNEKISYGAVAAAVAIACAGGAGVAPTVADAATLGGSTLVMSKQSNALATSGATQNVTLTVTVGANMLAADRVKLSASPTTLALFPSTGKPANVACGTTASTTGTLGASNYNSTDVSFRLDGTIAENAVCTFVVAVRPAAISGTVGISYQAFFGSSSDVNDSAAARTVARVVDQFASTVKTRLNNTVDVNLSRYHFTADDGTAASDLISSGREDQLVIGLTNASGSVVTAATVTSVTATIIGDFSFLDDDGTAGCATNDIGGNFGVAVDSDATGTLSVGADCRSLVFSTSADQATGDITIALGKARAANATAGTLTTGVATEKVLTAPNTFTASVAFTYYNTASGVANGTASVTTTDGAAAGSWDLNGATIKVGFMPYSDGTSRIINLTNRSAQTGTVTVSAINEAGTACPAFSVGSIGPTAIKNLSTEVDAGVRACYGATFAGRVALELVANIPGDQAELYTGYNRNGSLSTIVNSSN